MAKIRTNTVMKMEHFHDFYFLQALKASTTMEIAANSELEFSKPIEKFLTDLEKTEESICDNIARRAFVYLYAASFGEARHARDNVAKTLFIKETYGMNRRNIFEGIAHYPPSKANLNALVTVFKQDWRAGYGGTAWGNIAEALLQYGAIDNAAWIDHIVDLEHNNGTAFSKSDAYSTIQFDTSYPDRFSSFLDYKFAHDILRTKPEHTTYLEVSSKVFTLLQRYSILFKKQEVKHVKPELENLSDYVIEWGNKEMTLEEKWCDWGQIGRSNKPSIDHLMNVAGLYDFFVGSLTLEQLQKKLQDVKAKALEALSKNSSPYMKSMVTKRINQFLKENAGKCKLPKAKSTFSIMPCHYELSPKSAKLMFALPYQGYGTQTDYGFELELSPFTMSKMEGDGYVEKFLGDVCLWMNENYLWITDPKLEALID